MSYYLTRFVGFAGFPLPQLNVTPSDPFQSQAGSSLVQTLHGSYVRTRGTARDSIPSFTLPHEGNYIEETDVALNALLRTIASQIGIDGRLYRYNTIAGVEEWAQATLIQRAAPRFLGAGYKAARVSLGFEVRAEATGALWYSENVSSLHPSVLDPPNVAQVGAENPPTASATLILENGNAPTRRIIFDVKAGGVAITSFNVTSNTSGHIFSWTGSLPVGQVLRVDVEGWLVEKNGVDAYSGFTKPANKEEWFKLLAGNNNVNFVAVPANAGHELNVYYNKAEF